MGITIQSVKCPDCGASLPIEEGRTQVYCSYCGAKVFITNENEHIYRHIDEAELKQAETDRIIKLRQIEMDEKNTSFRKQLVKVWLVVSLIMITIAIGLMLFGGSDDVPGFIVGFFFLLFVCCPIVGGGAYLVFKVLPEKESNKIKIKNGGIKIPKSLEPFSENNVDTLEVSLRAAGFTNIKCINLHDVKLGLFTKNGSVESVSVNGTQIDSGGKVYMPDDQITITYHGR